MAFSNSIKNPPLLKTRNITSQNSINWHQIPATPTPTSPQSTQQSPANQNAAIKPSTPTPATTGNNTAVNTIEEQQEQNAVAQTEPSSLKAEVPETAAVTRSDSSSNLQLTNSVVLSTQLSNSTETDV